MVSATYFSYDDVFSGAYGLEVVDFNATNVEENEVFAPSLSVLKVPHLVRFFHGGITYDSAPSIEFSAVSQQPLDPVDRAHILSHLMGRNEFKELKFHTEGVDQFTYRAVFTDSSLIYVNGECHGIRFTATLDSPFARGDATIASTTPSQNVGGKQTISVWNRSQLGDSFTYPKVEFQGPAVTIYNLTIDPNKNSPFAFSGLASGEHITVDNETKIITSDVSGGISRLSNFTSRQWLKLVEGVNRLEITSPTVVTVTCPYYAMIGY